MTRKRASSTVSNVYLPMNAIVVIYAAFTCRCPVVAARLSGRTGPAAFADSALLALRPRGS
jgi:hypothetical protein